MLIIRNKVIPFKGFKAINLFGILFVRENAKLDAKTINHEGIHTAQMKEMLYIFFYLWYVIEWIIRLFGKGNAYRKVSFEKEAYNNQDDVTYLTKRKKYNWLKEL